MRLDEIAREVVCIEGDFPVGCLCIYIDCGANKEQKGKSGISHLSEHFYIKLLRARYLREKEDANFSCMGYTDYMYTTIFVTFTENCANLADMIKAMDITEAGLQHGEEYFAECKREILRECRERKDDMEKSLRVNSFLTDNVVDYVPVGDSEAVETIHYGEFISFFRGNYNRFRCALLTKKAYGIKPFGLPRKKDVTGNRLQQAEVKVKKCSISDKGMQKLYFPMNREILAHSVALSLVEQILSEGIRMELGYHVFFMKKRISESYTYEIVCVDKEEEWVSRQVIDFLQQYPIGESDLVRARREVISQLQSDLIIDLNYAINNVVNYFVYGENLLLNSEQIQNMIGELEQVTRKELTHVQVSTFGTDYRLITGC